MATLNELEKTRGYILKEMTDTTDKHNLLYLYMVLEDINQKIEGKYLF